jgi:tRNA G18 (ribose-2'-O)-methylase SpoU
VAVLIAIDNPHDERLDVFRWRERQLASKAQRAEKIGAGLFVAEGDLVVERALATKHHPVALLCSERLAHSLIVALPHDVPLYVASGAVRQEVTGLGVPLEATGVFRRPPLQDPVNLAKHCDRIVVLEAIDNPTNIGSIVRSAAALGWDGILLDSTSADPLARRALRVSMGAALSLPFARTLPGESPLEILKDSHTMFALTPQPDAHDIRLIAQSLPSTYALVLGSERDGLSNASLSTATHCIRIPMHHQIDSLNVGIAAAIAMYELGPQHTR